MKFYAFLLYGKTRQYCLLLIWQKWKSLFYDMAKHGKNEV